MKVVLIKIIKGKK